MTMDVSERISRVEPSATLAISSLAKELESEGADIIDLSVGEPDFDTPAPIVDAAEEAIAAGHTGYTSPPGIPELREAITTRLAEDDLQYDAENLIVTPGAKQALYEAFQTAVDPGDEVVLLDPAWVSYEAMVKLASGTLERVDLTESNFKLEPALDAVQAAITDETKVIVVNTPSNPTGVVYSDNALAGIRDLAIDHDLTVMSDEIYQDITYGDRPRSLATFDGMAERTITINGFSKSYAMTGWRLGYLAAPTDFVDEAVKLQSHSVSCATNFVQHAGIAALEDCDEAITEMVAAFDRRRQHLVNRLKGNDVSLPAVPEGAFYLMVPVAGDDTTACQSVLEEEHVATTPGSAFGAPGFARISYANSLERIDQAVDRLLEAEFFDTS